MLLSDLVACTLYHFQIISVDGVSNSDSSSDADFITSGCAGSAVVTGHTDQVVTVAAGANMSLSGSSTVNLSIPANFSTSNADFQIKQIDPTAALSLIGAPVDKQVVGTSVYDIKAMQDTTTSITSFSHAIGITMSYTLADIEGLTENSLIIYRWDSGIGWQKLDDCSAVSAAHTVSCTTSGFSTFALFGVATPTSAKNTSRASSTLPGNDTTSDTDTTNDTPSTKTFARSVKPLAKQATSTGNTPGKGYAGAIWAGTTASVCFAGFWLLFALKRRKKAQNDSAQHL
jgi:hypothetical protein